jgi:hypothetical protein
VVSFGRNMGYASGFDKDGNPTPSRSDDISTDQNSFFECVVGIALLPGFSPAQQGTYQSPDARGPQTYSIEGNMCSPLCVFAPWRFQCDMGPPFDSWACPCRVRKCGSTG